MDVLGIKGVIDALTKLGKAHQEALGAALYQEAAAVMNESLKEVPVDSGGLRQSHFVAPAEDPNNPVVVVGYGKEYGIFVHERNDLKHKAPTKSHFLSDPMMRATAGYAARVAKRTQDNLRAGIGIKSAKSVYPTRPKG